MPGGSAIARHLEVERKFDVPDDGELIPAPSFTGAVAAVSEPISQVLDAVYFDTPTRELAARRITLRRRTGGTDSGWHLKLPAGPDTRTEIRAPLADGDDTTVPGELLDMVLAVIRDRPLAPVARIATSRDVRLLHGADGSVLAEFCDDRVDASRIGTSEPAVRHWREWEVELIEVSTAVTDQGLLDRLGDRLLAAGAVPAGYGSKLARALGPAAAAAGGHPDPLHRALAEQVDQLVMWDRAVREDGDDAVHQLRVCTRRIRSLLQAAAETLGVTEAGWAADELRWLAGVLGTARDAEVLAQRYRQALDRLAPRLVCGPVAERLVDAAAQRYRAGWQRSLTAMRSPRYFRLLDRLDTLVAEPSAERQAGASTTPETIDAAYRRVCKAVKAVKVAKVAKVAKVTARAAPNGDADHDEALHRVRKAAKRLRYTAAAAGAAKVADRAKVIQTLLGDHQDSVVSRAHLLQQAESASAAGENTFTYGLLYQQEEDLARDCRAQLDSALEDLAVAVRAQRPWGGRVGL